MAAAGLPELVWTDMSTPPTSSTECESNEPHFFPYPQLSQQPQAQKKLRKLPHPPPSFHAFSVVNQSDLSFIADEPPEQSNFPFIFPRRTPSLDHERTFKSHSDSGHSYAYTPSLHSSLSRPTTFLSMTDSQTPLLRSLSAIGVRKSMPSSASTKKLTKRRPPGGLGQFKPLPIPESEPKSLPMLPPAVPSKPAQPLQNAPKRRGSISRAFTVALKRRLSMPKSMSKHIQEVHEQEPTPRTPHKHRARSSTPVRTSQELPPLASKLSMKFKGKSPEKGLPFPPPPPPPAKDEQDFSSSSHVLYPPTPVSTAPMSSTKLRKARKDNKKKFTIGVEDDADFPLIPGPAARLPLIHTHLPSDIILQSTSPTEFVHDLSLDQDSPALHSELPSLQRPQLVRKQWEPGGRLSMNHPSTHASIQRRWTLAMAMTSNELTDEVFVAEVEKIRQVSLHLFQENEVRSGSSRSVEGTGGFRGWEFGYLDPDSEDVSVNEDDDAEAWEGYSTPMLDLNQSISTTGMSEGLITGPPSMVHIGLPRSVSSVANHSPYTDPDKVWSSALHALLVTRDLLRTERNYLDQIKTLLSSSPCVMTPATQAFVETTFLWGAPDSSLSSSGFHADPMAPVPPPPLMHAYLLSLITLSCSLLKEWEREPTVNGVGQIFVSKEEEIERVFVGWCGVVGGWMTEQKVDRRRNANLSEDDKKRRRRLSKTKFLTPTSSVSHLNSLTPLSSFASISAPISLTSKPSLDPSSVSVSTMFTRRPVVRSSTTSIAAARWRKSMPNVPDLRLDVNLDHSKLTSPGTMEPPKSAGPRAEHFPADTPLPQHTLSTSSIGVRRASTHLALDVNGRDTNVDLEERGNGRNLSHLDVSFDRIPSTSGTSPSQEPASGLVDGNGRRIHSVRELGILPVQRVTRYSLLFRDLLKQTPATSPSHLILEQASEAANRIAAKCDRAQGNAEFFFNMSLSASGIVRG
ncbi:hypothetical protein D9757_004717 [Collybiopsis confluens]|uniref:DH domain-containing protein n=1 Tax=Collybiopsis confluens TaxID=2823264 RepID=A0A8H5HS55_9AGAR|nr:hypothetical protein D9757_004717 [Collybiopsis confluens]